jgi:hypothetical protein
VECVYPLHEESGEDEESKGSYCYWDKMSVEEDVQHAEEGNGCVFFVFVCSCSNQGKER